ncbi:histidine--tRNA ligase [bacterium]|nr:histidine--tRNA ligase [bacterium]
MNLNLKEITNRMQKFKSVKGFKDILPEDQFYWDFVRNKFISIVKSYGFERIDLPILENSGLFVKSVGSGTDMVDKEMFSFETLGKKKVSLRPEGTAGTVRSYIEHGMLNRRKPVKLFYLGPMFRYDRPQAGRYRQFHQFGLEIFGESSPVIDAQLIFLCKQLFSEIGIETDIHINSIGCQDCRKEYIGQLKNYLKKNRKNLCPDCQSRYLKNTLRVLDCKEKGCQEIVSEAPQIIDYLCDDCNKHFVKVLEYLGDAETAYQLNPLIVRGLDYYNRTVFEIFPKGNEKRQSALGAGGRYDDLVRNLGGSQEEETPAIGVALGMKRIINILKKKEDSGIITSRTSDIFVAQLGERARKKVFSLFERLRRLGFDVAEDISKTSLKQQLEEANNLKVKFALIIGQKEILDKTILIRDMESGSQEIIPEDKVEKVLIKRLKSIKKV